MECDHIDKHSWEHHESKSAVPYLGIYDEEIEDLRDATHAWNEQAKAEKQSKDIGPNIV